MLKTPYQRGEVLMRRISQLCPTQCWIETLRFNISKAAQFEVLFVGPARDSLRVGTIAVSLQGAIGTDQHATDALKQHYYLTADSAYLISRVDRTVQIKKVKK